MRFRKVYLEISNICNLRCAFCPGTVRKPQIMDEAMFRTLLSKIRPYTEYVYFHLMGEPLLHPQLALFLSIAHEFGLKVILTTNGTLLSSRQEMLLSSPALHKVNISVHAFEANDMAQSMDEYLDGCIAFGKAAGGKQIVCYRLWNEGGANACNDPIVEKLHQGFPETWVQEPRGIRMSSKVYLEHGEKFDWPDETACDNGPNGRCYGLVDQIGVLADGTVVPCCLDHDGGLALGNLLQQDLDDILRSPRAEAILQGFRNGRRAEALCRKCGFAAKFK